MFYYQHLLYSLMAGVGIAVIAWLADKEHRIGWKYLALFVLSMVTIQHLTDVDHYMGSVQDLVNCGLKTSVAGYKSDPACVNMHRGIMHQVRTGLFFIALFIGWLVHDWKRLIGIFIAGIAILYSLTQEVYVEASLFYLLGLVLTGLVFKKKGLWVGVVLLAFAIGWTQHMFLDELWGFWIRQIT